MDRLERMFMQTDFSKHTDLKARLAEKLFADNVSRKTVAFRPISDDDAMFVNAAQGLYDEDQNKNKPE